MATAEAEVDVTDLHPNGALGPLVASVVREAGLGDLDSLRRMLDDRLSAFTNANAPPANRPLIAIEALVFGRLVASRGEHKDIRKFAGVLCAAATTLRVSGRSDLGDAMMAESVSILEQLAEIGDDLAAVSSAQLLAMESPDIVGRVQALRQRATAQ